MGNQLTLDPIARLSQDGNTPDHNALSWYWCTTHVLSASASLELEGECRVQYMSAREAESLATQVQRRHVFSRHSRENDFYVKRAMDLGDRTVIEVRRKGDPNSIGEQAIRTARRIERLVVLSTIPVLDRVSLLKRLGISGAFGQDIDFAIDPHFRFVRSRTQREAKREGVHVDGTLVRRFKRCGFDTLWVYLSTNSDLAERVERSQTWLFDSRTEHGLSAATVKTAVALESLLILAESESLAQTLSERAAFILTRDPSRRRTVGKLIKRFYDVRSGVVHGGSKKTKKPTVELLDIVDRIVIFLHLILAANTRLWPTKESLREWCETQRWGTPDTTVVVPFPDLYIRKLFERIDQELTPS